MFAADDVGGSANLLGAGDGLAKYRIYISEQVCIRWRSTGAYYTAKLAFSHNFPIKVWGAYYTSVRIIFKFLW